MSEKLPESVIRQSANEALVSLVVPLFREVLNNIAYAVADDCEIPHDEAKRILQAQYLKFVAKYPQHALNLDYLSIWAKYHPSQDYETPFKPNDDSNDDISPYGSIAA